MSLLHYCTLASNASLRYCPDNTLSKFTNVFPYPLQPGAGKGIYLRLRSLAISPRLREANPQAEVIQIYINELAPSPVNADFDTCLARITYPSGKVLDSYAIREFNHTLFVPCAGYYVNKLSVLITDRLGRQLQLEDGGFPTLLHVELAEMDISGRFAMTCMSHQPAELQRHPDNTLTNFKVSLGQDLSLDGYEVALTSIVFPYDIARRATGLNESITIRFTVVEDLRSAEFTVDTIHTTTGREVIERIVNTVNDPGIRARFEIPFSCSIEQSGLAFRGAHPDKTVLIKFPDHFLFGRELRLVGRQLTNVGWLDIRGGHPSQVALLYCDCIEENIMGEDQFQLLHIVPMERNKFVYEPRHLIYHPVIAHTFNTIEFTMADTDGAALSYESQSSGSVIISLSFRPTQRRTRPVAVSSNLRGGGGGGGEESERTTGEEEEEGTEVLPYSSRVDS